MTNNFELIKNYMIKEGIPIEEKNMGDLFFEIMLVRRGKDHPTLPAANYTFKNYYIDSIEKYEKLQDEIIKCCEMFGLRAYVSVNIKSKEEYSKMCAFKFNQNILNNEYKKPWRVGEHVFGKLTAKNNNVWLIDVDDIDLENEKDKLYISKLINLINSCTSTYNTIMLDQIPTKSGLHILTRPFNAEQYKRVWIAMFNHIGREFPEIKRNHITLLYENINI